MKPLSMLIAFSVIAYSTDAFCYFGPGLGVGAAGAVLGFIGSIFLALFAVIYYPIKRFFKRRKKPDAPDAAKGGRQ